MKLKNLGFDQWFEAHAAEFCQEGCCFARVSAVDRGSYRIIDGLREVPAELSGKLSYQMESPADLPCVGDWVTAQFYNNDAEAIIHRGFPRKTFLRRKTAGKNIDYQMVAANIDTAFIFQSCHFDFNPRRLDRYLVMAANRPISSSLIPISRIWSRSITPNPTSSMRPGARMSDMCWCSEKSWSAILRWSGSISTISWIRPDKSPAGFRPAERLTLMKLPKSEHSHCHRRIRIE